MMIGARTAAWAKSGGWVNPYVTDGLVAMWDGEWNAGGGVHDPNATVWKNLVDTTHNYIVNEYGKFGDNFLTRVGGVVEIAKLDTAYDLEYFSQNTIEAVFAISKGTSTYRAVVFSFDNTGRAGFAFANMQLQAAHLDNSSSGFAPIIESFDGVARSYSANVEVTGKTSNSCLSFWVNGTGTADTRTNGTAYSQASIFGGSGGSNYKTEGRIYCLRLYDRMISDDERLYNYAIDKARFNLPDA